MMIVILRLTLVAVLSVFVINFIFSSLIGYFYQSETEAAIQKSTLYLEQAKKNQEAYLEAKYKANNNMLIRQFELEQQMNLQIQHSQHRYDFKINEQIQEERFRQEIYDKIKQENLKERKQKQQRIEEIAKRKRQIERENRAHIRNENIKNCTYWTQQYKEISTAKNKVFKEAACSRAYL